MPDRNEDDAYRANSVVSVLENRISTLDRQQRDLASDIAGLGGQMERSLKAAVDSFGRQMDALSAKVDERSKIPWPALGVMLSFVTVIGGLVWYPVKSQQDHLAAVIEKLSDNTVTKSDLDYRLNVSGQRRDDFQRQTEARSATNAALIDQLRDRIVPRSELEEKWRGTDQRSADMQRQIDDMKRAYGDTFNLRDAIQIMQRRLDTIETGGSAKKG